MMGRVSSALVIIAVAVGAIGFLAIHDPRENMYYTFMYGSVWLTDQCKLFIDIDWPRCDLVISYRLILSAAVAIGAAGLLLRPRKSN